MGRKMDWVRVGNENYQRRHFTYKTSDHIPMAHQDGVMEELEEKPPTTKRRLQPVKKAIPSLPPVGSVERKSLEIKAGRLGLTPVQLLVLEQEQ